MYISIVQNLFLSATKLPPFFFFLNNANCTRTFFWFSEIKSRMLLKIWKDFFKI